MPKLLIPPSEDAGADRPQNITVEGAPGRYRLPTPAMPFRKCLGYSL